MTITTSSASSLPCRVVYRARHVAMLAIFSLVSVSLSSADFTVNVDFGERTDPPLVKKLSLFNSGLVSREQYERDVGSFGELKPEAWRMDLSMGKADCPMWANLVGGNVTTGLTYDWTQADWLKARFDEQDILPYWGLSYIPFPLQLRDAWDGWMYVDNSNGTFRWDRWKQVGRDFAAHFKAGGRTGYYEIYNEGDLNLSPTLGGDPLRLPPGADDAGRRQAVMNKLHIEMAKGIREGDADAVIGGPSYSGYSLWFAPGFCDAVAAAGAPLDFLSYHSIAIDDTLGNGISRTDYVRGVLRDRPQLRTTEMHLDEYFAYSSAPVTPSNPDGIAGDTNSADLATRLIDDLDHFLVMTDVTQMTWAFGMDPQFPGHPIDSFIGLVATEQAGPVANRRRAFSAFAFYGDIPVQRVASNRPGPIRTLAGLSADKAAVIMWNTAKETHHVSLTALGIPFYNADVSTYVIDGDDDPKGLIFAKSRAAVIVNGTQSWNGNLEGRSVTYVTWTTAPVPTPAPAAQLVRIHRDFPARGSTRFGEFDRRTWTGYVGTGSAPGAGGNLQQVGVTVRGLAGALRLEVDADGTLPDAGGALGLRVDYQVGGTYTKSVFFHGGAATPFDCPWGTGQPYQQAVEVPYLWRSTINVAAFAPAGWNGQAVLTMVLANAAANTRARFALRPGDLSSGGVIGGAGAPPTVGTPTGTGTGLLASYAPAQDFAHPLMTRIDATVDFEWDHSSPDPALALSNYCVRWTGQVEVPTTGSYTIIARTDDGVRLWLNGEQVLNDWIGRGASDSEVTRTLTGGQKYDLRMEYYQGTGNAAAHLKWIGPGIPRQTIPKYRLYPATGATVAPVGDGLIAWYRFIDVGSIGMDSSGNANHAVTVSQVGRPGTAATHPRAVDFTAASRFAIPCSVRDDFSIACWIKPSANGRTGTQWWEGTGLLDGEQAGASTDFGVALIGAKAAFGIGNADQTITSSSELTGAWHHLTVTRRNGDGRMELFVDGVRQATAIGPTGSRAAPETLTVGSIASGYGRYAGSLDDLRIYNRVMSDSEIADLAAAPTNSGPGGGGSNPGGSTSGSEGSTSGKCGNGVWVGSLLLVVSGLWWRRRTWAEMSGKS